MDAEQLYLVAAIVASGWLCLKAAEVLDPGDGPAGLGDVLSGVVMVLLGVAGVAAAVWASVLTIAAAAGG